MRGKEEAGERRKRRKKRNGKEKQEEASRTVCPGWPRREAGKGRRRDRASAKRPSGAKFGVERRKEESRVKEGQAEKEKEKGGRLDKTIAN